MLRLNCQKAQSRPSLLPTEPITGVIVDIAFSEEANEDIVWFIIAPISHQFGVDRFDR